MLFRIHSIEVRYAIRASVQATADVSFIAAGLRRRAAVKDGTDPKANQVDLSHIQDVSVGPGGIKRAH